MSRNTGSPALAVVKHISDLILRSAPLARVSKDGRESLRCVHPSRRLLRKLLRMRSVSFTGSFASDDGWERDALISQTHLRALAAQCARGVDESSAQRGRGERRMPVAPAASCALVLVKSTRVTTSTPKSPDVPARNGLTAYNALSPEYRAFLPPSPSGYGTSAPGRADMPPKDLTPTTEASGPHDFAVSNNIVRLR